MKTRKIPTHNLGAVAYYLLQITQGIFKLNGELSFCPFVRMENREHPFHPLRITTWTKMGPRAKPGKADNVPAVLEADTLFLFTDPVHPATYTRTRQRATDMAIGIDSESTVLKMNQKLIIKRRGVIHTLEFVRKLSDKERLEIFPKDGSWESHHRNLIHEKSKNHLRQSELDKLVEAYDTYRRNLKAKLV